MPVDHYENFPVASLLLPARLRSPVEAIYAFARSADDIADEGDAPAVARLAGLNDYRRELHLIEQGKPTTIGLFGPLAQAIDRHRLPIRYFRDLLDAFSQDVGKTRYASYEELRDYCRRSADPVGRLMLTLFDAHHAPLLTASDAICTSLQLINFWQDVAIDWAKGRVYLPQDELERFGVTEAQIAAGQVDDHWRALMRFQVDRARALMQSGASLPLALPGRVGWELRLIVLGGLRILQRIEAIGYDVFRHRPTLGKGDALRLALRALNYTHSTR
ncbi:squalene synthase HpnC [Nitrogeniibacter mangrovi]|uniref:Squalene synthase HpnC n=1 Tax=Nitrogeniibacter mangrovi TaxID=2016596 RepID=A0A6C1B2D0_9RHOO|nr:squalene synthase HpnC [Nitrogeniibacter mangrovi]QID17801.1 squalene synthase HpnC [Nitrogeniibacter mangrovi]